MSNCCGCQDYTASMNRSVTMKSFQARSSLRLMTCRGSTAGAEQRVGSFVHSGVAGDAEFAALADNNCDGGC